MYMSVAHCYECRYLSSWPCGSIFNLLFVDRLTSFIHSSLTRQCPGNHLVDSSVWLLVVSMLATLDISKAVDDLGNTVEPTVKYNNAVFRYVVSSRKYFCSYGLTNLCFLIITDCLTILNAIFDRARRKLFLLLANLGSLLEFFPPRDGHLTSTASCRILHLNHDMSFCALPLLYLVSFLFFVYSIVCSATLLSTPSLITSLRSISSYKVLSPSHLFLPSGHFFQDTNRNSTEPRLAIDTRCNHSLLLHLTPTVIIVIGSLL